jgi:hypothetical protein
MPIPIDHQMVGAAAGGPFTEIECPSDDAEVAAADIRRVAAALLANDVYLASGAVVPYQFTQTNFTLPAPAIGPPNTFSGATWTDSIVALDVPNTKASDDLRIEVWGTWQLNSSSAPGDVVGEARIQVTEDVAGTPSAVPVVGIAVITDDSGALTLPHEEPYVLRVRHRITNPGTARVTLQVRSEDLTGGAGTATLILLFSARLDVDHAKRS